MPFCLQKCGYCDFYSFSTDRQHRSDYVLTLIKHIQMSQDKDLFCDSLYFGGGTPSLMQGEDIQQIIKAVGDCFRLDKNAEITLEVNPGTVTCESLKEFRQAGVNRLSIGVQSLDDSELKALSRLHNAQEAINAIQNSFQAGFDNVSCDIMFGVPNQTLTSLEKTTQTLTKYPISHISAYGLKIEPLTPFGKNPPVLPDEDIERQMYFQLIDQLEKEGFEQYEISNFAKKGKASRHNLKYWQTEQYLAFGPSASGFIKSHRYTYAPDLEKYTMAVQKGQNPPLSESYTVDSQSRCQEKIIFGLRLTKGIDLEQCQLKKEDFYKNPVLSRLIAEGFMDLNRHTLRLLPKGMYISNSIINEILLLKD